MKISKIDINHLRNDAHFQFHTEFRDLVAKHNAETLKIKPQFDTYLPLYDRVDKALKKAAATPPPMATKNHRKQDCRDNGNSVIAHLHERQNLAGRPCPTIRTNGGANLDKFHFPGNLAKANKNGERRTAP